MVDDCRSGAVVEESLALSQMDGSDDEGLASEGEDDLGDTEARNLTQKADALETEKFFETSDKVKGAAVGASLTLSQKEDWDNLPQNIYSIIYYANPRSHSFVVALLMYAFQASVVSLALADLIDIQKKDNPIQIPAGVTDVVRAAQFLALILAVAAKGDMVEALQMLSCGYDEHVQEVNVHASFAKWLLAYLAQFTVGGLLLIVNFCLLVNSSSVLNLFLNFAALWFIQEIDDVAFRLGTLGYFTNEFKEVCDHITEKKTPRHERGYILRRVALFLIMLSLLGGWILVVWKQLRGDYDCKKILVQFGDSFIPALAAFSGVYELDSQTGTKDKRRVYINTLPVLKDKKDRSFFRYCRSHEAWVFGFPVESSLEQSFTVDNICHKSPPLKSPDTDTFDITSIDARTWMVANANSFDSSLYLVEHMFLACNDCSGKSSRCQGVCDATRNICRCESSQFGDNCEFPDACRRLNLDERTESFISGNRGATFFHDDDATEADAAAEDPNKAFRDEYARLRAEKQKAMDFSMLEKEGGEPIKFNSRPVYTSELNAVMLFNGRRWLLYQNVKIVEILKTVIGYSDDSPTSDEDNLFKTDDELFDDDTLTVYEKGLFKWLFQGVEDTFMTSKENFTSWISNDEFFDDLHKDWLESYGYGGSDNSLLGEPEFVSEPLDLGSPKNQASPHGLNWYTLGRQNRVESNADASLGRSPWLELNTKFICTVCNDYANPCLNNGICMDGRCECFQSVLGTTGALCESHKISCAGKDATFQCQNGFNCSTDQPDRCACDVDNYYGIDCSMKICPNDFLPCLKECSNQGFCVCHNQVGTQDYMCCGRTENATYCDGFYDAFLRFG